MQFQPLDCKKSSELAHHISSKWRDAHLDQHLQFNETVPFFPIMKMVT